MTFSNSRRVPSHLAPLGSRASLGLAAEEINASSQPAMRTVASMSSLSGAKKSLSKPRMKNSASASSLQTAKKVPPITFATVRVDGQAEYTEDDGSHVDHALEMFRTGQGMGGGDGYRGNMRDGGYRFDGHVAAVGSDGHDAKNTAAVSSEELKQVHNLLREKIKTRFSTFRKGFRQVDENNSGRVTKTEALRMLMMFNMTNVREAVVAKLCDIMDRDGNGIEYDEFCDWLMAEDASHLPNGHLLTAHSSLQPAAAKKPPSPPRPRGKPAAPPPPASKKALPSPTLLKALSSKRVDGRAEYTEDDGSHVDHALEMFRTGQGMGGGDGYRGNMRDGGYRFDGHVAAVGSDGHDAKNTAAVSSEELKQVHNLLREKIKTRFSTFRKGFRQVDENNSGRVTKTEALRMLMMFNMTNVREAVVAKLCDIMDRDGNGIEYDEFCDWLMAEDASHLPNGHLLK